MQGDVSVFGATDWYDITDYQLLDGEESGINRQLADACSSAASECLGLVLREDVSRVQSKVHHFKVGFTGVARSQQRAQRVYCACRRRPHL